MQILPVSSEAVGPGQEGFPPTPGASGPLCTPGGREDEGWASVWALNATGDLGIAQRPGQAIGTWRVVLEPGTACRWGWVRAGDAVLRVGAPGAPF